jgi:hypothetical protein
MTLDARTGTHEREAAARPDAVFEQAVVGRVALHVLEATASVLLQQRGRQCSNGTHDRSGGDGGDRRMLFGSVASEPTRDKMLDKPLDTPAAIWGFIIRLHGKFIPGVEVGELHLVRLGTAA